MSLPKAPSQLRREVLIASLADGFQVHFKELGLLIHLLITNGAGKVVHAPGLVQRSEHCKQDARQCFNHTHRTCKRKIFTVSSYDLVANKAEVAKQLVIMSLTVSETLFLVVTMAQEGLLTFGTHKVLEINSKKLVLQSELFDLGPTSTCQCFPRAVTTRSSIGRRHAPQMGMPILSWQRKQYNSFCKKYSLR